MEILFSEILKRQNEIKLNKLNFGVGFDRFIDIKSSQKKKSNFKIFDTNIGEKWKFCKKTK